jgi:hypothetical protein
MKTLLFILMFVPAIVVGQNETAYLVDEDGDSTEVEISFGEIETAENLFYATPSGGIVSKEEATEAWTDYSAQLMSLAIMEYAEDCYNDSTLTTYQTSQYPGSLVLVTITEYIHRKPTFEGFIAWLEKRKK